MTNADYHIGYTLQPPELLDQQNTLADGTCCDATCGTNVTCCNNTVNGCMLTARICFRESQDPSNNISFCPLLRDDRDVSQAAVSIATTNTPVQRFYTVEWPIY